MFRQRRRAARDAARDDAAHVAAASGRAELDQDANWDESDTEFARERATDPDQPDRGRSRAPAAGPWDVAEVDDPYDGRFDLGALLIPEMPGLELRLDVVNNQIISATGQLADSELKIQAFAAPRTEGLWDEVRSEIKGGISAQGGTVDEVDGPLGPELRARVTGRTPDGKPVDQAARFFGIDGPRWFLHATLTGRGAREPHLAGPLEDLLRGVVVVRGEVAMPPRELIPLRLPEDAEASDEAAAQPDQRPGLDPFRRGPEITEIH